MNRISYTRATLLGCFALVWTQTSAGQCISYAIVKPFGTISNLDPVRLEILAATSSSPTSHEQPMKFAIVGNEVAVRMWIVGGPDESPSTLTVTVELGLLDPGTYRYAIALHPETDPPTYTADGTFCVEDSDCSDAACRCPVFDPQYSIIDLGTFDGGYSSRGQAINDRGDVAGRSYGPNGQHAFLWQDGVMLDLNPDLGTPDSEALDINDAGQVVGWMGTSKVADAHAFLWQDGAVTDLGVLPGGFAARAAAIDNLGRVVGWSKEPLGKFPFTTSRAFLWEGGEMIGLGTLPGFEHAAATDINDAGQIVGVAWGVGGNLNIQAAII
ncbi:MAG: hypothetical protein IIB59_01215, partial [Planctomycetes bacterium]|nr:hypothetical protein [Planctomycetota bacterium]